MSHTRFLVGDVVTVRSDLDYHRIYEMESGAKDSFVRDMEFFRGKHVVIDGIINGKYRVVGSGKNWVDEMFEEYFQDTDKWVSSLPECDEGFFQ